MRAEPTVVARTSINGSAPVRHATIMSVAAELPQGRLTNAEIADRLGITEQWILSRTGIRERRRATPDERLADYAARAGSRALRDAGVDPAELDLVIVGTMTPDEVTPNSAPLVAHALGAHRAGAFDVGAACTAFLSGLAIAAAQIETGRAERILLVGADFITRLVDYDDKQTAPLFADGAGAAVLGAANGSGGIGPILLGADGSQGDTLYATHDTRQLRMDGREVFRHAVTRMCEATEQAIASAGLSLSDIDLFVYHQANARITRAVGERLELDSARVIDCIEELGNTSAGTLPIALTRAVEEGRLWPGARVLLSAFGAGFTWGAGVMEWSGGVDG
jgi:3-oxoacyl-[acyl-carrier-protein] synthase III